MPLSSEPQITQGLWALPWPPESKQACRQNFVLSWP